MTDRELGDQRRRIGVPDGQDERHVALEGPDPIL